jgi:hypothetical protein
MELNLFLLESEFELGAVKLNLVAPELKLVPRPTRVAFLLFQNLLNPVSFAWV